MLIAQANSLNETIDFSSVFNTFRIDRNTSDGKYMQTILINFFSSEPVTPVLTDFGGTGVKDFGVDGLLPPEDVVGGTV